MTERRRQRVAWTLPLPVFVLLWLDVAFLLVYLAYWTLGATVYLVLTAAVFRRTPADELALIARSYRAPKRLWRRVLTGGEGPRSWVVAISLLSIIAAVLVLPDRESLLPSAPAAVVVLVAASVAVSWLMLHVVFAQHYALTYVNAEEGAEPLVFGDGTRRPDYWDFAYFSFTVGTTFGTTDVTIRDPDVRRAVLGHGLMSFAYNTVILALLVSFLVSRAI